MTSDGLSNKYFLFTYKDYHKIHICRARFHTNFYVKTVQSSEIPHVLISFKKKLE